jgi:hypothetical protein
MAEMSRDYVIRKRGYFYRPEAQGYCADVRDAGRWTYEDAIAYQKGVEGVTVHHLREFPAPLPDEGAPSRFHITWRNGAYYVSIPNYRGGEVVPASIADDLVKALEAAQVFAESVLEMHGPDHAGLNLDTLNKIDRALARVKSTGEPNG